MYVPPVEKIPCCKVFKCISLGDVSKVIFVPTLSVISAGLYVTCPPSFHTIVKAGYIEITLVCAQTHRDKPSYLPEDSCGHLASLPAIE